jgi:hypothetical protein
MIEVLCIFAKEPFLTVWSISSNFVEPPRRDPTGWPAYFRRLQFSFCYGKAVDGIPDCTVVRAEDAGDVCSVP